MRPTFEPSWPGLVEGRARPVLWDQLAGFGQDDLADAFACFRQTAGAMLNEAPVLRPALVAPPALRSVCAAALAIDGPMRSDEARAFFMRFFQPFRVSAGEAGGDAFFTGYYEPVVEGSPVPTDAFTAPILARPDDLRTFAAEDERPKALANFSAARIRPDGALEPYPDRAAIEDWAMAGDYRPLVWLRDWVEVFLIHVQGSARVRLPDGAELRLTYAGRNGHPYTSIGKILIDSGAIALDSMSLDRLKAWVRQSGQAPEQAGRALMRRNSSYIFFEAASHPGSAGPIGGAGTPLRALRSIAVDRTLWSYGLPFWVDASLPWRGGAPEPFRRLTVAQDTGSAILGPARADLFFGSGAEAGRLAGQIRHRGQFTVLLPRPDQSA